MKVFFAASTKGNVGPSNANRGFFENWSASDEVRPLSEGGMLSRLLGTVRDALWCDVVVSGGPGKLYNLVSCIAKTRKIPVVGYCHGYAPFENEINRQGLSEAQMRAFVNWLDGVNVVATNSELQKRFLEEHQPTLEGKVETTLLGVEPFQIPGRKASRGSRLVVAVSGGTRPIKCNDVVARAVRRLKERGIDVELRVYGEDCAQDQGLDALIKEVGSYRGQMPRDEFVTELGEADVFVMNSRHDSFGLSAIDAFAAGCSLLLSANCGVKEVFETMDCDVVSDCENVEEVAEKIAYLVGHPNCERLYSSIDFEDCSWAAAAGRLREICVRAVEKRRG